MRPVSKDELDLVPPCNCHVLDIRDWPLENGNISVSLCMETCPYCGQTFPSCFDLQEHLLSDRYRKRDLKVSDEIGPWSVVLELEIYSPKTNPCIQCIEKGFP
jgi:hypothetical protein